MISEANISKLFILIYGLLLAGCFFEADKVNVTELKGDVFGSYYQIKYTGEFDKVSTQNSLDALFLGFNQEFSTYQNDSVISIFNNAKSGEKIKISPRFVKMLELARSFHEQTDGAFDPTLGPVIKLWGFGGGKIKHTPSDLEIQEALGKVGFKFVKWNEFEIWKEKEGLRLDVNAFAPGWVADLVGDMLHKSGVHNFMVDIGGEILFKGEKGKGIQWTAGIEKPAKEHAKGVQRAFKIKDQALATSGNYRQFFTEDGVRRSHIIDPRTGRPVTNSISSASVIAQTAGQADAWGTAMMILGPSGLDLAEKQGLKVLLLDAKEVNSFEEILSPSMKVFLDAHRL